MRELSLYFTFYYLSFLSVIFSHCTVPEYIYSSKPLWITTVVLFAPKLNITTPIIIATFRTHPRINLIQRNQLRVQQQRRNHVQRSRRRSSILSQIPILIPQHLANNRPSWHIQPQQSHKHRMLLRPGFERFQYDIQHSVRIQIETANQRFDDHQQVGGFALSSSFDGLRGGCRIAGAGRILMVQFGDEFRVAFRLFAKQIEASLFVTVRGNVMFSISDSPATTNTKHKTLTRASSSL